MAIDYTITIGNIAEICSIIIGGLAVLSTLKTDVKILKVGSAALRIDLASMQAEIKKLGEVMIDLADIRGQINVLNTRTSMAEQDIRELKHGHGYVEATRGIDREYK